MSKLDEAYAAQIKTIRTRLDAFTSSRFKAGQYRDTDMARFIKETVPVILAGRRQVSALTDAYLAQVLSQQLGKRVAPRGPIDTNALRGVDVKEVYARPFITVRTKLSEDKTFDAAVSAGVSRLNDILLTDLQMAKTYTAQNVISNSSERITGYERILTGSKNCALCIVASTQRYHRGNLMPIHPGCDCGINPIADSGKQIIHEARLEAIHQQVQEFFGGTLDPDAIRSGRTPDYRKLIVTHEHGEIGPLLAVKGQHFAGPSVIK